MPTTPTPTPETDPYDDFIGTFHKHCPLHTLKPGAVRYLDRLYEQTVKYAVYSQCTPWKGEPKAFALRGVRAIAIRARRAGCKCSGEVSVSRNLLQLSAERVIAVLKLEFCPDQKNTDSSEDRTEADVGRGTFCTIFEFESDP